MNFERSNTINAEKELPEEEILKSNNVELIAKYAKENRSQVAIDKVRELLELSRKIGEEVVQNFLNSFKECEAAKIDYLNFENTEGGRLALSLIEKMPEPFRANANTRLENYKKELKYNAELFKNHQNNPEKIWKEIFGFDYYNIPEFKERFKTFLFKDMRAVSDNYYKNNTLEAKQGPFSINFFVGDSENFDKAYGLGIKTSHKTHGFSEDRGKNNINVINTHKPRTDNDINNTVIHETEHAIHSRVSPSKAMWASSPDLTLDTFDDDKKAVNNEVRLFLLDSLKRAKDEIFAYQKGGATKASLRNRLLYKIKEPLFKERESGILDEIRERNHSYDYNEELREANYKWIELSKTLLETEKKQLKDAIDFLQSEYDRVVKNMVDVVYEKNQSVEFFRNVPINELWKYSNGKHSRTDFVIKEFKF